MTVKGGADGPDFIQLVGDSRVVILVVEHVSDFVGGIKAAGEARGDDEAGPRFGEGAANAFHGVAAPVAGEPA